MVRIAVIGGREFSDVKLLESKLGELISRYDEVMIISGAARGADTMGVEYAKKHNIPYKEYEAEWDNLSAIPCKIGYNWKGPYNLLAGFNRNTLIVEEAP